MRKGLILLIFILSVRALQAQTLFPVNVSINLVPPYSTRLSDYANNPGKVLITLRNTQPRDVTVYLRATISGDNGILVFTQPDYRPVRGITLRPNVPFTLTVGDLQEVFDINQLTTRGITMQEIERKNGLPEGVYQVCVRAYDLARPAVPLSSESPLGCTTIRLTSIEPPMLIKPFENEEVTSVQPQNMIFSWTLPAGAPPGTRFRLRLIELLDPKRNPNDAFLAGTQPPFFEKTVTGNVYVYGPADPALTDGRKYAWAVTALDPNEGIRSEGTAFRNGGRSEVRAFSYKQRSTVAAQPVLPKNAPPLKPDLKFDPEMDISKLLTTVSGKLLYAYPEDYKMIPVLGKNYQAVTADNYSVKSQHRPGGGFMDYLYEAPAYLNPVQAARPAKRIKVTLVMVYAYNEAYMKSKGMGLNAVQAGNNWSFLNFAEGDLYFNNKKVAPASVKKVLATGYTNDNGEFNLGFAMTDTSARGSLKNSFGGGEFKGNHEGAVKKTCVLIIDSPYYCTPFIMVDARPGDNIVLPELVSLVKSQQLNISVRNNTLEGQMGGKGGGLENINLELFRLKPMETDLPEGEGQSLPSSAIQTLQMGDFSKTYPISKVARVVALDRTNAQGKVTVPRVIRIDTRKSDSFIAHSYSDKNVGVYNKFDGIKVVDAVSLPQGGIKIDNTDPVWDATPEFNSFYQYSASAVEIIMASKNPVVKGKVVEKNMGLKNVQVLLKTKVTTVTQTSSGFLGLFKEEVKTTEWKPLAALITKEDGYFEFNNLSPGDYVLEFSKSGYKPVLYPAGSSLFSIKPFSLQSGQLLQTNDISMNPSGSITACVSDEDGNRVVADIRVDDGAYYKTLESGIMKGCVVNMPAPGGNGRKIKVSPRASDVFFDEDFTYNIKEEGVTNIPAGTLVVLRRKHRIRMQVNGKQGNNVMPLEGATVTVKEYSALTDSKGVALLEFESPGTEFVVKVKPADNFSHWEKEMMIPVTKKPVERTVELTPARTVLATVTENIDGKAGPSAGARVYIKTLKSGWGNNSSNYAECITDAKGQCILKGIPVTENNLEVFVAKESDKGTFTGEKKEAYWMNGQFQAKVDLTLSLKSDFKINDVWGFPVNIETVQAQAGGAYMISGSFRDIPGNPNFTDTDSRLDFKNILFVPAATNGNTHQPEKETVTVEQKSFRVKVGQGLQGMVTPVSVHYPYSLTFPKIHVMKNSQGKAELKAAVKLELSSFEGAYQLSGKIEIGENLDPNHVLIFSASNLAKRKLNLGSSGTGGSMTNLKYKVHNFNAEAEAARSYISGDSVNLFTVLHTNIQDMSPADLAIQAGYITVLPDKIVPFSGGDDISFSLEKWKVTGQKPTSGQVWKYDKNNGGISIDKAVVNTGIVAVNLNQVIIKPDRLIADKLDLNSSDAGAFSLGGIVPLEILPGTQTLFAYDPNCYHDNKPHWKLTIAAKSGMVAARVSQLEGLAANDKLEFGSMNLFSDNQQQLNGPSAKKLTLFKVLKFSLNTIDVGKDFFTLVGQAGMDIPNMTAPGGGGITGQIVYSKNPSGQVKADIKPLYFQVEGKGQVTFKADDAAQSQTIADGLYTSKGKMKIYDTPSGKAFEVDALLKHQKTAAGYNTSVEVLEKQKIPLEGKFLEIKPGLANSSMKVAGGAWEHLVLNTVLPSGGFQNMSEKEAERSLTFIVKGALETDPSKGKLGVTGMDTGFGNMSLFYNFAKQEVRGDFTLVLPKHAPIKCGIVDITSVGGAVVIGTGGMYMRTSATGDISLAGIPIPIGGTTNLLLGYYSKPLYPEDLDAITDLAVNKSYPPELNGGIKGMYASFVLKASQTLGRIADLGVAEVGVEAHAGLAYEYRTFLNFRSPTSFDVETGMFGYGEAGITGVATVAGVGGKGHLGLNIQLALKQKASPQVGISAKSIVNSIKSLKMEGCGSVGGTVKVEGCAIVDCFTLVEFNENISARFTIGAKPDISFSFNSCGNGMPMETLSTKK